MEQDQPRISSPYAALIIAVAVLFDAATFIPVVNIIVVPVAWLTLWVMFWIKHVSIGFVSPKRLLTTSIGGIVEAVPMLSALPAWTVVAIINVVLSRLEDKGVALPMLSLGKGRVGGIAGAAKGFSVEQKAARRVARGEGYGKRVAERAERMRDIRQKNAVTPSVPLEKAA